MSDPTATVTPVGTPGPYTVQTITYCSPTVPPPAVDLPADVYTPLRTSAAMPLIIYIHGGLWITGDKSEVAIEPETVPTFYVTSDDAPVILDHGVDDTDVYYQQSIEFATALAKATVTAELTPVRHAGHVFVPVPPGATIVPSLDDIASGVLAFFNATLVNNPNPQPQ